MGEVFAVLSQCRLKPQPDNYPQRMVLERCENIHWHYRELRLEFSINEFFDVCRLFSRALPVLQKELFKDRPVLSIPISEINPFDAGHIKEGDSFDCGEKQEEHKKRIEALKEWIRAGHSTLPIAVCHNGDGYVRMDGFKRFWAYKELGYSEIDCYVLDEYIAGVQEGIDIIEA